MDRFLSFSILCCFPLPLFLLCFLSLHLSSSAYTPPEQYFINCGSDTNTSYSDRRFAGDSNSGNSLSFSFKGQSSPVKNMNSSTETEPLYQTARIFKEKSSYEFQISSTGIYVVRLHFFAFRSSDYDLSSAIFDVSASGFSLLRNFTMNKSRHLPVEEFFLSLKIGKFTIQFLPRGLSFAFVNAMEVFLAPEEFIPNGAPHISPATNRTNNYEGILSKVLQTIHRINVGGVTLTPDNDTLWRYWAPDDAYLYMPEAAKNSIFHEDKPKYQLGVDQYIAPDPVYQTAKEMNVNPNLTSNNFNVTWSFNVSKNAGHFVRVHFCDIISQTLGNFLFNLYIYRNYSSDIYPYDRVDQLAAPFYMDFVVDSDDSGLMNISIGPRQDSSMKTAFLNGLEIMEIVGELGSVLVDEHEKLPVIVIVGSIVGGLVAISILAFGICLCLRCRKPKSVEVSDWIPVKVNGGGSSHSRMSEGFPNNRVPELNLGLKISFAEIMFATNNFDEKMIVGKGGYGPVFRGTLRNGTKVAVKRSEPGSSQGLSEFRTEIMVLSKIRHRHLVSLIGYCDEMSEMILVYEFVERGTLRDHLYNSALPCLSWRQRLEICIGAAKGLQYLHRGAAGRFIHRDVKSTNILLDECLVAKVSDFGLSTLGPPDQTHVSCTSVKGTFGYFDPEYFKTHQLTEKSDVYSFGVVLLEVLCARPAINTLLPMEQVNLADWGLLCKQRGTLEEIVDPLIKNQITPNSLRKFADIAEKCLQEYGADRPYMTDVEWDLEYALQLQQTMTHREPHEDSATDASTLLMMANVQRYPSLCMSIEKDDMPILSDNSGNMWSRDVFSQLRITDAR